MPAACRSSASILIASSLSCKSFLEMIELLVQEFALLNFPAAGQMPSAHPTLPLLVARQDFSDPLQMKLAVGPAIDAHKDA